MTTNSQNNKRIAKNTMMLYIRMLLIMAVTLYTSRVVLEVLGVEDFGIYNIVGGVVVMLGFLNSAMSSATQRFLSFEMGCGDFDQLKKVFSLSVIIHAMIAISVLILAETIGLWFLNTQLVIPAERMEAANWVYQFSILAFMVNVMSVPYNAAIISHERMNVYAYVSVLDVFLKLAIVFLLQNFGFDKLQLYAILVFVVSFIIQIVYRVYCKRKFDECTWQLLWDKMKFKEMIFFSGWNFLGGISFMTVNQGINIVLNLFFGPSINAARAVAVQVQNALNQFVSSFMQAVNPQIVKYFAAGDKESMYKLIFVSSRYSFFLISVLSMPIIINMNFVLNFWLKNVPEHTVIFTQLILIYQFTIALTYSINIASQASGNVKLFQIVEGCILILTLPTSYLCLRHGMPAYSVFIFMIVFSVIAFFARLLVLKKIIQFPVLEYVRNVLFKLIFVLIGYAIIYTIFVFVVQKSSSILGNTINIASSFILSIGIVVLLGLSPKERKFLKNKLLQFSKKYI